MYQLIQNLIEAIQRDFPDLTESDVDSVQNQYIKELKVIQDQVIQINVEFLSMSIRHEIYSEKFISKINSSKNILRCP